MKAKKKSLAKNTVFNMIYTMTNIVFPLISSMYVARVLLAEGVGKVAYAQNIASYFVAIGALGLPTYGVREIAKVNKSKRETDNTFTELILINGLSTTVALIMYIFMLFFLNENKVSKSLFIVCGLQIVLNYINVDWFFQGKEEYGYITARSLIVKVISFGSLFVFVRDERDYLVYALINVVASGGNYFLNIWYLRRFTKIVLKNVSIDKIKKHLLPLSVLAIGVLLGNVYSKVDTIMLGIMTSEREVGLYTYAHRIPEMIVVLSASLTTVFLPRLSLYYKENLKKFNELVEMGVKILCFISIPLTLGFFVLTPEIMRMFFGEDFLTAILTARVFAILIIVKSFGNLLCYQLIICTGNEKKRLPAYVWAAGVNVALNAILIPFLGATGAAISSVISELLVNGIQMFSLRKIIQLKFPRKSISDALISTLIMTLVVMIVKTSGMIDFLIVTISMISGIIIYMIVNVLLKNDMIIMLMESIKEIIMKKIMN